MKVQQQYSTRIDYDMNLLSLTALTESFGDCNYNPPDRIVNLSESHQPHLVFVLVVFTACVDTVFSTSV